MLTKRAHWAFRWSKYACIILADIWTCYYPGAWRMFGLMTFCISNCLQMTLRQWFSNFHEQWSLLSLTGKYLVYRDTWVVQYHGKATL